MRKFSTLLALAFVFCLASPAWAARVRVPVLDGPWWHTALAIAVILLILYFARSILNLIWGKIMGMISPGYTSYDDDEDDDDEDDDEDEDDDDTGSSRHFK